MNIGRYSFALEYRASMATRDFRRTGNVRSNSPLEDGEFRLRGRYRNRRISRFRPVVGLFFTRAPNDSKRNPVTSSTCRIVSDAGIRKHPPNTYYYNRITNDLCRIRRFS